MNEQPDATERRRRARVAWAYSGLGQPELADAAGIEYGTLKAYLRVGGSANPDMDQLLAIGRASGVPDAFMLYGWSAADRIAALEHAAAVDRERYDAAIIELRAALVGDVAEDLLRTRERAARDRAGKGPRATRGAGAA